MARPKRSPLPVSLSMPSAASREGSCQDRVSTIQNGPMILAFAIAAPEIRKFPEILESVSVVPNSAMLPNPISPLILHFRVERRDDRAPPRWRVVVVIVEGEAAPPASRSNRAPAE